MEVNAFTPSDNSMASSVNWATTAMRYLRLGSQPQDASHSTNPEDSNNSESNSARAGCTKPKARLDGSSSDSNTDEMLQKLSRINGAINKMTKEQLQEQLGALNLNTSGVKDVLKKRLKYYHKRQRMAFCHRVLKPEERMQYDYLVVIDYEATCSETNDNFVHEIIEFPAVLIDVHTHMVCNVFQRFCKPKINPKLTAFCTALTGITQAQVDKAKDFTEVFQDFQEWMRIHGLGSTYPFAILTDGPWDMARFLKTQAEISEIQFPSWAKHWINLRKAYSAFYDCNRANLQRMLEDLGMTFQGRPHCGLDDSRNIAAIAIRLLEDGCVMRVNEHYYEDRSNRSRQMSSPTKSHVRHKPQQKIHEEHFIPQEGDDLGDLLLYSKLQKN